MLKRKPNQSVRVGVDTGGTFTDFVFRQNGRLEVFKLPSTPSDPSLAIRSGLKQVADKTGFELTNIEVVHGTTVGTNTLLQRRGARAARVAGAQVILLGGDPDPDDV